MRDDIKTIFFLLGVGCTLIAYAHATFSTKESVKTVKESVIDIKSVLRVIDQRVFDIHKRVVDKND